ncbi:MAG: hypothetical protein COT81_00860 [Candidatus Buchananbacteria bacterium CG10_big_fil_rev_8_21_14_0_10_42_9]|uniref:Glycosyltransferase 2-like domain-containing protein n=1 Tax=Candidatus Buchananbacteria bacterium CG10_big_fil_rev_8_21_14_0_10_42_9 TaxID=1974526 RepID=A0A2H0W2F8_9BACT|nr:MAG: hypothetical protein COT81_00860 [Candidatus Buchananbacteria bacterium CG10_big_fil_rev_8_21_14_0_10_42_9]
MNSKVGIVILSYNSRQDLPDCLSSVDKAAKGKHQVIVVDNASSDNSAKYVKDNWPQVILIENTQNIGYAGGNNTGIKRALKDKCDYIYILNPDAVVDKDFLDEILSVADTDKTIAITQSKILHFKDKNIINSIGNAIHYLGFGYTMGNGQKDNGRSENREVPYGSGAAMLLRADAIRQIGIFDETFFMYHEDLALGWLARLAGYKIMLAPKSVVYHKYEFSKSIKKFYYMERNRFIVLLEYYKLPTLLIILPALIMMEFGLLIFSLKSGFWREKLKAYGDLLRPNQWQIIMRRRKQIQSMRVINDRDMSKNITGVISGQEIESAITKYLVNPVFAMYWFIVKQFIFW